MNEFIEPNGSMVWASALILLLVLIPNLINFFSTSKGLMKSVSVYWNWQAAIPSQRLDEDARTRITSSVTLLILIIQTSATNVLACGMLGWILWHGQTPSLAPWAEFPILVLAFASIIGNFMIVGETYRRYSFAWRIDRLTSQLRENMKTLDMNPAGTESISMAEMVGMWGRIGVYILSAVLLAILMSLLY